MGVKRYEDLQCWQLSDTLKKEVYRLVDEARAVASARSRASRVSSAVREASAMESRTRFAAALARFTESRDSESATRRCTIAASSIESCRANLSSTLREMSQKGQPVIGRCASEEGAGLDAITTGAVDSDFAVVRVTRMQGGGSSTTAYRVPKSIQ